MSVEQKKVIIAHPGRQHSFHLADALKKRGLLSHYVTTVYDRQGSWTHLVGKFLKGDAKKRFANRKSDVFDENVTQYYELLGLLVLLLNTSPKTKPLGNKIDAYLHDRLYRKTIRLAQRTQADAIVFYGGLRQVHFDLIKQMIPHTCIIVDVPIVANKFLREVAENDIRITGDDRIRTEQPGLWGTNTDQNTTAWATQADAFLVGSSVVKNSIMALGAEGSKAKVIPYGVDTSRFFCKEYDLVKKVHFIFVGTVYRRKGIQHLLPAFASLDPEQAELTLVGDYQQDDPLVKEYAKHSNIHFKGFVTQDVAAELYRQADVFVLPSLGEGLAQVGIEAMASGLPIICSENSGVNDIVTEGKEGFVIPVSDSKSLRDKMQWFIDHKDHIEAMGRSACETGHQYTWEYYEQNAAAAICSILDGGEH